MTSIAPFASKVREVVNWLTAMRTTFVRDSIIPWRTSVCIESATLLASSTVVFLFPLVLAVFRILGIHQQTLPLHDAPNIPDRLAYQPNLQWNRYERFYRPRLSAIPTDYRRSFRIRSTGRSQPACRWLAWGCALSFQLNQRQIRIFTVAVAVSSAKQKVPTGFEPARSKPLQPLSTEGLA